MIASIHQPSTSTFELFDKLLFLASGRVCFNESLSSIRPYLDAHGTQMPLYTNPAEFLLDLTSSDFAHNGSIAQSRVEKLHSDWEGSPELSSLKTAIADAAKEDNGSGSLPESKSRASFLNIVFALLHRSFIKSYRDVVAYGIRFAMYLGQFLQPIRKAFPDVCRPCHYDGDRLAPSADDSEFNSAIYQCNRTSRPNPAQHRVNSFDSSSAPRSCHLWPLLTCLHFLRTARHLSKSAPTASMAPRPS